MGKITVNVAGVTFENPDGSNRQEILASMYGRENRLYIEDAATTRFPEAIAVYNEHYEQIGYLPADIAKTVRQKGMPISSILVQECRVFYWKPHNGSIAGMLVNVDESGISRRELDESDLDEYEDEWVYGCGIVLEHPDFVGTVGESEYRKRSERRKPEELSSFDHCGKYAPERSRLVQEEMQRSLEKTRKAIEEAKRLREETDRLLGRIDKPEEESKETEKGPIDKEADKKEWRLIWGALSAIAMLIIVGILYAIKG